jgi:hypothetical protein
MNLHKKWEAQRNDTQHNAQKESYSQLQSPVDLQSL